MPSPLSGLEELVPPPSTPVEGMGDWESLEKETGLSLPEDYKEFIRTYGSGTFDCGIQVYNYLRKEDWQIGQERLTSLRSLINDLEADEQLYRSSVRNPPLSVSVFPLPLHPEPGGIFPWGFSQDWWDFYWICQGPPSHWGVAVTYKSVEEVYSFPGLSLTRFLIELARHPFDERFRLAGSFRSKDGSI